MLLNLNFGGCFQDHFLQDVLVCLPFTIRLAKGGLTLSEYHTSYSGANHLPLIAFDWLHSLVFLLIL